MERSRLRWAVLCSRGTYSESDRPCLGWPSAHRNNFAGPGAGEQLQLDHPPHMTADVWPDGLDERGRDRLDRFPLDGLGAALGEPFDGRQSAVNRLGDNLVLQRPIGMPAGCVALGD